MERVLIRAICKAKTEAEMSATAKSSRRVGLSVEFSEVGESGLFVILSPFRNALCSTQLAADRRQQLDWWEEIGMRKLN